MKRIPRQAYTTGFKEFAVKRVADRQIVSLVVKALGLSTVWRTIRVAQQDHKHVLSDQTLRNWMKAVVAGNLNGAGSRVVTLVAMELSRLRAEVVRLKRENEIVKMYGLPRICKHVFDEVRKRFASMYPAYDRKSCFLALMESTRTLLHKAFSH
jgi:transposase